MKINLNKGLQSDLYLGFAFDSGFKITDLYQYQRYFRLSFNSNLINNRKSSRITLKL